MAWADMGFGAVTVSDSFVVTRGEVRIACSRRGDSDDA